MSLKKILKKTVKSKVYKKYEPVLLMISDTGSFISSLLFYYIVPADLLPVDILQE